MVTFHFESQSESSKCPENTGRKLRCYEMKAHGAFHFERVSQRDQSVPREHTLDFTKLFILHLSRKVQTPPLFSMAQEWFSTIETIACCAGGGRVDKAERGGTTRHLKK